MYTDEAMRDIVIAHRKTRDWSDWAALGMVRFLRWGTDVLTGYRHNDKKPYIMSERKWMLRFIFLETVAGVPGMVGGTLRHLRSLSGMRRDNGWRVLTFERLRALCLTVFDRIESLLEEAYNERMHLLTFLTMAKPGRFMKFMVLGAQGVFVNGMFIAYLISPRTCHRFVGYLEEEAVRTYTYAIQDIEDGRLPEWTDMEAPEIAVRYWQMPEGSRKMRDLLLYIRADEAKHREVNHTLGNLNQAQDPNPYVSEYKDKSKPHPTTRIEFQKPTGWERKDVV